jgi:hypothetical protein
MVPDPDADKLQFTSSASRTPWQYSLRGLLIVTTVVSICLTVGVYFAGVLFVLGFIALIQVATLLAADWLIRPQNRRALAVVSAGSWLILGSGLVLVGSRLLYLLVRDDGGIAAWVVAVCLATAGLYCFYIARNRWRRLITPRLPNACAGPAWVEKADK